ncbi:hypothetical protein C8R42DRAFT_724672 [Lentinula raphanica]|nr:hypothetical protein C8R42DRAFT_724672 [Lentinula raphanica]
MATSTTQTAPVMTLYVDLLTEIFDHVLRQDSDDPWSQPYRWKALITLTSVCAFWRSVCLGEPLIWTQIGPELHNLNIIHLHLERSDSYPLTIHYRHDSGIGDVRVLALLAQHSERWLDVTLVVPSSLHTFLSSVKGKLPVLRNLVWNTDKDYFPGFEVAPSLQRSHLSLPFLKEMIILPWSQLTQLTCEYVHDTSLHSTLPLMPNLSLLSVRKPVRDLVNSIIPRGVNYPQLLSLEVVDCDFQILRSLLHVFPKVKDLTIAVLEMPEPFVLDESIPLPNLSSIHLDVHRYLPGPFLSRAIQIYAPNLSELNFHVARIGDYGEERDVDLYSPCVVGESMLRFLTDLISNARCSLRTLKLAFAVDLDCAEMAALFTVTPDLEVLEIAVSHGMECIPWRFMTPALQTFPQLKTFDLYQLLVYGLINESHCDRDPTENGTTANVLVDFRKFEASNRSNS